MSALQRGAAGALVALAGCASTGALPPVEWERAVAAGEAVVAARAGYALERTQEPTRWIATWRQPRPELDDWATTAFGVHGCDPWCRLELRRSGRGELAARVVELDFVLWVVPQLGTNERAEARLLSRFAEELARLDAE